MTQRLRTFLLLAAAVAAACALLFARPRQTPGPPMRDFEAYYAAGTAWDHGGNPYSQQIWQAERTLPGVSTRYEALPFVTPPALLPLFGVLAKLPFTVANAVWRGVLLASLLLLALVTLRMMRVPPYGSTALAIVIAELGFGPLTSAVALGQLALPAFALAALSVQWAPAAIAAWSQPNVALPLLSQASTWTKAREFALSALAFAALCVPAVGVSGIGRFIGVLHAHAQAERFSAIQITPAAIAYGFGAGRGTAVAVGIATALAALFFWVRMMRMRANAVERFCASCAVLPFVMPFFHEHDLLVVFIPALVYTMRAQDERWTLAAFGALLAAPDWLGLAQRPDGAAQTLLLIGALGLALVALRPLPTVNMLAAPAAAALVLIAAAAMAARAHPAPVWPDAMTALPAGVSHLNISAAWSAEQRATGLLAPNAVWAALRLLSLLGCACVAASSKFAADSRNPSPAPAADYGSRRYT